MVQTVVLNQSNVVPDGQNNKLVYNFPNSVAFPNHEIAIQSVYMYYSWVNINNASLNNNLFYLYWPTNRYAGNGTTFQTAGAIAVDIPDGLYEIATLNQYLQWFSIKNGYYLINDAGENVYYWEFIVNPSLYAIQLNLYPVPTALPANWIAPTASAVLGTAAFAGFPTTAWTPQVYLPFAPGTGSPSDNFYKIIGFAPGKAYPAAASTSNYSIVSTTSPQVQPNPVVFLALSNIENNYATPSSIIGVVSPQVGFGELIQQEPPQFAWNKLLPGTYNSLRLSFVGTDKSQIQILDPQMTITLVIRDRRDVSLGDAVANATGGKA
jgi:hypothetical protein